MTSDEETGKRRPWFENIMKNRPVDNRSVSDYYKNRLEWR
jgi:hypothetical protein